MNPLLWLKATAVVAVLAAASACGTTSPASTGDDDTGDGTSFAAAAPTPDSAADADATRTLLLQQTTAFDNMTPAVIDGIAQATCDALDELSVDQAMAVALPQFGSDAGAMFEYAVEVFCPEHNTELRTWVSQQ